jgi:type I restriction enzyme S subunit
VTATLAEVCTITMGQAPNGQSYNERGEGLPLIAGAGDFNGLRISPKKFTTAPGKVSEPGDIILSIRASIGAKVWSDGEYCLGRGVAGLRPKAPLDSGYLWHWLTHVERALAAKGRGATFLQVNRGDIGEMPIELPPLPEQRRIAAILDHSDALRAKRREAHARLDSLTQSIFHDMFGDLRSSTWAKVPFRDVIPRVDNGTSPNCESRPAGEDEWGVLKLGAVTYGQFRANENKAFVGDLGRMTANEVKSGDVLMTRKNTRELVGAVALVDQVRPQLLLPDLIFRLHLDTDRVDRRYFHALMMNPQKRPAVRDLSSGSASSMPNISKARLAQLPLELPPLSLQHEFASKVESVEALRAKTRQASAMDDVLLASLQSRAFRGEL